MSCYNGSRLIQTGLHPGLHAQVTPPEAGQMEQAGPLRWPARVHTELHRERWEANLNGFYIIHYSPLPKIFLKSWSSPRILEVNFRSLIRKAVVVGGIIFHVQVHTDWPSPLRNKGVFFVKREAKPIPEDSQSVVDHITCGDVHPNTLGNILILFLTKFKICFRPFLCAGWGSFCPNIPKWAQHGQVSSVCLWWWEP